MGNSSQSVTTRSADNLSRLCGKQVSITLGNDEKQYFCSCWGVCPGRFFMTQMPMDPDIQGKLTPGNKAVIRFVESGMVCGFKANIQQAVTHPFRLIFFDHPTSLEMLNLRTSKRVPIFLKATIQKDGEDFDGVIRDLSDGGCFYVMKYWQDPFWDDLGMETDLLIKFTMQGDTSPTALKCKPARVIKDKDDIRMGLSFVEIQQDIADKLASFIDYVSQFQEKDEFK